MQTLTVSQLVSLLVSVSPSAPCNCCQSKLDLCHITGKHVYMITVNNCTKQYHLASHTVAPQITRMNDTIFGSYGMEKIIGLRSEFGRQLKRTRSLPVHPVAV